MKTKLCLLVLCVGCFARMAPAQLTIDWFSIDSGGGASAGGFFTLNATIADLGAATLNGGPFSLDSGFWVVDSTPTTNPPPALKVVAGANHTILVSWPSPSTGWSLQRTPGLALPAWSDVTAIPADDGTTKSLSFDASSGSLYLRLKH